MDPDYLVQLAQEFDKGDKFAFTLLCVYIDGLEGRIAALEASLAEAKKDVPIALGDGPHYLPLKGDLP